ncbi:MAG: M28 family peptidase [Gemmatimonadaceae bacterium]|nr:M28 family peptidase [Gemmatimonadaceae bacterium]
MPRLPIPTLALALSATTAAAQAPTTAAISVADLRHRSFLYAADSMEGRETASRGHVKATDYIAAELKRLGLEPAGEQGTYFQTLPIVRRELDPATAPSVNGRTFAGSTDFIARDGGPGARSLDGVGVIYGGSLGDTTTLIPAAAAAGKFVVLSVPATAAPTPNRQVVTRRFLQAAGIAVATLDRMPADLQASLRASGPSFDNAEANANAPVVPTYAYVSVAMAEALVGQPLAQAAPGTAGAVVQGTIRFRSVPVEHPVRNVVAILRGRSAALRGQYVALGAHSDHVGMGPAVDHDSVALANRLFRKGGADDEPPTLSAAQAAQLAAARDSVAKLRAPRRDSVFNGADDDGSGSMGLLEVAEYFARTPRARPARSLLFIWHAAEEVGLWGSEWFTDHPTVPRDSIASAINIDMIGRGSAADVPTGGDRYLQLLGSRRLSTTYGDFIETINKRPTHKFALDYTYDANGHPQQYYCRSDHWNYARYGIPVVFFSTGGHADYHMITDEPQYLDYPHFLRVTRFVADLAQAAANRPGRFALDKPVPGPTAQCVQ